MKVFRKWININSYFNFVYFTFLRCPHVLNVFRKFKEIKIKGWGYASKYNTIEMIVFYFQNFNFEGVINAPTSRTNWQKQQTRKKRLSIMRKRDKHLTKQK